MKVRLPGKNSGMGGMNIQKLAQQAQEAQKEVQRITEELEKKEYTASAGGDSVKVTVTGKPIIKKIEVKPDIVDPNDVDFLTDMIVTALNDAINNATKEKEEELEKITGGMNIPGLF